MNLKKAFIFFTSSLFIGLAFIPATECKTIDGKNIKTFFNDASDEIKIQSLTAVSPYDYGLKAGKQLNAQYRFLNNMFRVFDKRKIQGISIEKQITNIELYFPFFSEEMKGLAQSTHIDIGSLLILQNKLSSLFSGECTTGLATGKATKNNQTFLTFNIDSSLDTLGDVLLSTLLHRMFSMKCWITRINTLEYKYAFWGIPVLFEYPFLNEKGLGWGSPGTVFTENENRTVDEGPGISTWCLERLAIMTCKNVSEVARLYMSIERASQKGNGWFHMYDGSSSCFCDREGGILSIEQTHHYIITVFGNSTEITGAPEGILWHANHHQWLDPNLTGSVFPNEYPSSGLRAERMHQLLIDAYGNITLETCKTIAQDHYGGFDTNGKDSGDICRHPDNSSKKITAFSWIIMPEELTVFWTHTSPCKGTFFKHDFSKIFE